jgi:hypothetical protein
LQSSSCLGQKVFSKYLISISYFSHRSQWIHPCDRRILSVQYRSPDNFWNSIVFCAAEEEKSSIFYRLVIAHFITRNRPLPITQVSLCSLLWLKKYFYQVTGEKIGKFWLKIQTLAQNYNDDNVGNDHANVFQENCHFLLKIR